MLRMGKPNGFGILIRPDGFKYVGEWKNGKPYGQGTSTWGGEINSGEYKNGKMFNYNYDKNGNLVIRVINGEIIMQ